MMQSDMTIPTVERHEELLALLRMLGYALDTAESLGADAAATHMDAARLALMTLLKDEFEGMLSGENIARLANAQAGHC